ncbi:hypothetical protein [Caballeronia sp. RCC_10]|uniref:hypothetical protein n=1 Tax=Caballeronia sp. RCC_10 TaxID=3239227 RepID=UPI00352518EA
MSTQDDDVGSPCVRLTHDRMGDIVPALRGAHDLGRHGTGNVIEHAARHRNRRLAFLTKDGSSQAKGPGIVEPRSFVDDVMARLCVSECSERRADSESREHFGASVHCEKDVSWFVCQCRVERLRNDQQGQGDGADQRFRDAAFYPAQKAAVCVRWSGDSSGA